MKDLIKETLKLQNLTEEEKQKRGILGRLYGPCASIAIPTRNGRLYQESLWDYQFTKNDILKEMIENGGIPMELDHPIDREETDSQKIAAMLPELPKKDKDGRLICYVDLIDTPCGRIAYQLAKYGFKLGISSRGTGDVITDADGNESVDPETYNLTTFDLVLIPAVKDARLSLSESLKKENENNYSQLKVALQESLKKATDEDRAIMESALKELNIEVEEKEEECNGENCSDKEVVKENSDEEVLEESNAVNNGVDTLIKNLQEALVSNSNLTASVKELQEKLAVSNTKVDTVNEELARYKNLAITLSDSAKKAKVLEQKVTELENELNESHNRIEADKKQIVRMTEGRKAATKQITELKKSVESKDAEIAKLEESISRIKDSNVKATGKISESLEAQKTTNERLIEDFNKKLSKANKVTEQYKSLAYQTINRYIEMKANHLGISANEIKNRLDESYTIDDVDQICEELKAYKLNISKLPIDLGLRSGTKVRVTESKKHTLESLSVDDEVDDSLIRLAGLNK